MKNSKSQGKALQIRRAAKSRFVKSAMERAYYRAKRQVEEITNGEHNNEEYIEDNILEEDAEDIADGIKTAGRSVIRSRKSRQKDTLPSRKSKQRNSHLSRNDSKQPNRPQASGEHHTTGAAIDAAPVYSSSHYQSGRISHSPYSARSDASASQTVRPSETTSQISSRYHTSRSARSRMAAAVHKNAAAAKAIKDSRRAAERSKQAAENTKKAARAAGKALEAAIRGAVNATSALVAAIAAGGTAAVVIILVICLVGLIAASAFGIFAGNEVSTAIDGDSSRDLRYAVSAINTEYYEQIQTIRNGVDNIGHFTITINGDAGAMTGVWQDVLSVYAVDTAHGATPALAIDFDESKTNRLKDIFWSMVSINHQVTERTEAVEVETTDENGNTVITTTETTVHDLTVDVTTKSAEDAAAIYAFSPEQNKILTELMSDRFTKAWSNLIYGYSYGDDDIAAVAVSQIGNVGGEPYWRWYGLSSRTEWCAIFVSWCADQCGYIDMGTMPKFAWVPDGVAWFQARGQWQPRDYIPAPGDIIFFDWDHDGGGNHVGIVEYCENGIVHTVEGNSSDQCRRKTYTVGSMSILGYGITVE